MIVLAGAALGAVFLTAGLAKLADREGSRQAVAAFGVPARFARPAAGLLPIAELATAISLFLVPDHTVGAIAAIALLVVFTAAIAIALIRGGRPTCYCFGQLESSPIGARTLVRNTALLGGAAYLWLGSAHTDDPSPAAWLFAPSAAVAAGSAALAAVSVIGFFLLQRRARLRSEALPETSELAPGAQAVDFSLPDLDGTRASLGELLSPDRRLLLVFADPNCGPCDDVMPDIAHWQRELSAELTPVVVSRGDLDENRAKAERFGLGRVLVQDDREVALAFDAPATPTAVLIGSDGHVLGSPAPGPDAIRELVTEAVPDVDDERLVPSMDGESVAGNGFTIEPQSRRWILSRAGAVLGAGLLSAPGVAFAGPTKCAKGHTPCKKKCCKPGRVCHKGKCRCPKGTHKCHGKCVNLRSNRSNCGACGHRCPPGQFCVKGKCRCPKGTRRCGNACIDLSSSHDNCGSCGHACAGGEVCVGGQCTTSCPTGTTKCGNTCVDTATDQHNCGGCGNDCGSNVCSQGKCCVPTDPCAGACNTTKTNNCGQTVTCDCDTGQVCNQGTCCAPESAQDACSAAGKVCGSTRNNCGQTVSCGTCPAGKSCKCAGEQCLSPTQSCP